MPDQNIPQFESLTKLNEYLLGKGIPEDTAAFISGRFLQNAFAQMAIEFSEELKALGSKVDQAEISEEILKLLEEAVQAKHQKSAPAYTEQLLDKLVADFFAAE